MANHKSKSLFDDIFRLQNAAPDEELDPEDPEDGVKARLVDADFDDSENVGPSNLRRQAAIISDDPRYKGRKTARRDLYSDEEMEDDGEELQSKESESDEDAFNASDADEDDEESSDGQSESDHNDDDEAEDVKEMDPQDDLKILLESKSDDRQKGEAVMQQLEVWDDLIKSRIALQRLVTACNRLPQPDTWPDFFSNPKFRQEAKNVYSSVCKVMSSLLDMQSALADQGQSEEKKVGKVADGSDEEITSESEAEEDKNDDDSVKDGKKNELSDEKDEDSFSDQDSDVEKDGKGDNPVVNGTADGVSSSQHQSRLKRKLDAGAVEEVLAKRHADFQSYRNNTLSMWDEKTRLAHGRVKSKNFAAFEMSVLKQIEQVLVNRDRLIKRIHQKRSDYRVLGKPDVDDAKQRKNDVIVEDDDEDVELKLKQGSKAEISFDPEIIDDNDFYHVCLRDLIEMKQSEETDPVVANRQWLEIQRLRNKQKQRIDTKASKGRKIRYNVKEKLKNYMAPYDKSTWSEEQKDDLFKALFGGRGSENPEGSKSLEQNGNLKEQSIILGI